MPTLIHRSISSKARYLLRLQTMLKAVEENVNVIPVLSYNGSGYDINLIKTELFKQLGFNEKEGSKCFVVKKSSRYPLLSIHRFTDF